MSTIQVRRDGRRADVTIDRPPLNILDLATIEALNHALGELAAEPELQLVVLRGAGARAFSAGVAVEDHTADKLETMLTGFHAALRRLGAMPPITLAAVQGHCLGGGMELALACDLVLAADGSRFGQPEVELGCFPPFAAALYPSHIGRARTLDLLLTGRILDAEEAERLGLVTWRADKGGLDGKLDEIAATLLAKSGAVCRLIKRAVGCAASDPGERLAEAERLYVEELAATADMTEGLAAFVEKRQPTWKHR